MIRIYDIKDSKSFYNAVFENSDVVSFCSFKDVHNKDLSSQYFLFFEQFKDDEIKEEIFATAPYQQYRKGQKFHYYKLSKQIQKLIIKTGSFANWRNPDLPEDMAFYKNKKPWLYSISHEDIVYINTNDNKLINELEKFCDMAY